MSRLVNVKSSNDYTLQNVAKLIRKLIGRIGRDLYKDSDQKEFDRPFNELLLWAVLMNR